MRCRLEHGMQAGNTDGVVCNWVVYKRSRSGDSYLKCLCACSGYRKALQIPRQVSLYRTRQAANISRLVVISRCRPKAASRALCLTMPMIDCTASCLRRKTNSNVPAHAAAVKPVTTPVANVTKNLAKVWPVYLRPYLSGKRPRSYTVKHLLCAGPVYRRMRADSLWWLLYTACRWTLKLLLAVRTHRTSY